MTDGGRRRVFTTASPHGHQGGCMRQAQALGAGAPSACSRSTSIPPRIARGTPLLIPDAGGTVAVPMTKVMLRGNGKRFQRDGLLMSGSHDDRTTVLARWYSQPQWRRQIVRRRQSVLPITSARRRKRDEVDVASSPICARMSLSCVGSGLQAAFSRYSLPCPSGAICTLQLASRVKNVVGDSPDFDSMFRASPTPA